MTENLTPIPIAVLAAQAGEPVAWRFWANDEWVYLNPRTDAGEIAVQRDEGKELQAVYLAAPAIIEALAAAPHALAPDAGPSTEALLDALIGCISAMEMQIRREKEELHIQQPVALAIWDEALRIARAALASQARAPETEREEEAIAAPAGEPQFLPPFFAAAPAGEALSKHDQSIICDLEALAADKSLDFWPQMLALGALRIIRQLETALTLAAPAGEPTLLKDVHETLHHARIFITTREKMHPEGVVFWDELQSKVAAALAAGAPAPALASLRAANLSAALRAIVRECRGLDKPFSTDSYLPPHLLDLAVAALESTETPLQVIESMRHEDIERAPSYEELRERNREKRL